MEQKNQHAADKNVEHVDELNDLNETNEQGIQENAAEELADADKLTAEFDKLQKKYDELNDSHLRLIAEYDNYRKRTLREKAELIKNGGESTLIGLLPVVDDFERALANIDVAVDMKAVTEGVDLIYHKFITYLAHQGVKPIETKGKEFDTELCEAIATIPAPGPELKGKVLDCIQTGYTLNDKVIRHAKVVVGE